MPKPNTDVLMKIINKHFGEKLRRQLVFTRWKDGIDIEYPTYAIEAFTEAVIEHAAQLQQSD